MPCRAATCLMSRHSARRPSSVLWTSHPSDAVLTSARASRAVRGIVTAAAFMLASEKQRHFLYRLSTPHRQCLPLTYKVYLQPTRPEQGLVPVGFSHQGPVVAAAGSEKQHCAAHAVSKQPCNFHVRLGTDGSLCYLEPGILEPSACIHSKDRMLPCLQQAPAAICTAPKLNIRDSEDNWGSLADVEDVLLWVFSF